jgi:hypothetical protein
VSDPNREGNFASLIARCAHGVFKTEPGERNPNCSICRVDYYKRSQPIPVEASIKSIGVRESSRQIVEVEDTEPTEPDPKQEWFDNQVKQELEKLQPTEGEA